MSYVFFGIFMFKVQCIYNVFWCHHYRHNHFIICKTVSHHESRFTSRWMNYQNTFTHINIIDLKYDKACDFLVFIGKRHAREDKEKRMTHYQKRQLAKQFYFPKGCLDCGCFGVGGSFLGQKSTGTYVQSTLIL